MKPPRSHVIQMIPALFGDGGIVGGAERYVLELARAMATEVPTTLLTFGPEEREDSEGPLQIRVLGRPHYVRGQEANPLTWRLFGVLRPATVVHCHQQHVLSSSLAALFCRVTKRKVFVSDLGGGGWDVSGYLSTDGWYHGHLHISQYSRRVFGHAEHPRAHVILGGVDTQRFCPDPGVERTGAVLYVGRLLPHKGIDYLIEGLPDGMALTVIGPPVDARHLEDLRRLAAGKAVTFHHEVGDAELVRAYRSAACIVLPSVYRTRYGDTTNVPELLGQTLLEGMACGAPALATSVASLPEVVEDGNQGFLVAPNDAAAIRKRLVWYRDHPSEARRMGAAARQRVLAHFTWPTVVRRCLEIYGS